MTSHVPDFSEPTRRILPSALSLSIIRNIEVFDLPNNFDNCFMLTLLSARILSSINFSISSDCSASFRIVPLIVPSFRLSFRIVPLVKSLVSVLVTTPLLLVPSMLSLVPLFLPLLVTHGNNRCQIGVKFLIFTMTSKTINYDKIQISMKNQSNFFNSSTSGNASRNFSGISSLRRYVATPIGLA